jgi:hypothetical protein
VGTALSGTVSVEVRATAPRGLSTVRLEVDGKPVGGPGVAVGHAGLYRIAWDTRGLENGSHTLVAVAVGRPTPSGGGAREPHSSALTVNVHNAGSAYPVHTDITSTVFWIGEPQGNGSSESNALSAYDDKWEQHYGGYDNYQVVRTPPDYDNGLGFTPAENPFYLDLPYDDINDAHAFADRWSVVPWAPRYLSHRSAGGAFSLMKNQWVKIWRTVDGVTYTAYGQIEDAGPYVYDDEAYVFGTQNARPESQLANNAGLDVSPALRDYLHFTGVNLADQQNGDSNKVDWQFVGNGHLPPGPWSVTVTTRQVYQP